MGSKTETEFFILSNKKDLQLHFMSSSVTPGFHPPVLVMHAQALAAPTTTRSTGLKGH